MDRDIRVVDVLEQAADMSDRLQTMYDEQDECRRKHGSVSSWPRDKFESWVDGLSEDAQNVLSKYYKWEGDTKCNISKKT